MPKCNDREYRSVELSNFSLDDEKFAVDGYATTFDVPYDFVGNVKECIRSSAIDGDTDLSDVIFQFNHKDMVMARIKNGTLQLSKDAHGLKVHAELGGTRQGRDLYEAIKNGLIDRMSWGFKVAPDGWDFDRVNRISYVNKVTKVFDVSAVSKPANQDTEISARSYFQGVMEAEKAAECGQCDEGEELQRMALRLRLAR